MAQLHSLIALQQFMRGLGEEMDEAELVWNIEKKRKEKKERKFKSWKILKSSLSSFTSLLLACRGIHLLGCLFNCDYSYSYSYLIAVVSNEFSCS